MCTYVGSKWVGCKELALRVLLRIIELCQYVRPRVGSWWGGGGQMLSRMLFCSMAFAHKTMQPVGCLQSVIISVQYDGTGRAKADALIRHIT